MAARDIARLIWLHRATLIFVLTPLILLPLPLLWQTPEAKCAYVMLLMAVFWVTEVIHLAITSLLPVLVFPLIGLVGSKTVCVNYIKDISMMLLGGIMVALAIEHSNLHKRIAIRILMLMGSQIRWLMLGFMLPTFVFSMWISNTATTAMMIPISMAVVNTLYPRAAAASAAADEDEDSSAQDEADGNAKNGGDESGLEHVESRETLNPDSVNMSIYTVDSEATLTKLDGNAKIQGDSEKRKTPNWTRESEREEYVRTAKAMCLSIAYAANVGGIGTLTGTPPNLVLKEYIDELYEERGLGPPVTFTSWMIFSLPLSAVCLVVCWIWLQIYFIGFRTLFKCGSVDKATSRRVKEVIKKEYESLGPVRFAEIAVLIHFIILVLLWFFRKPGFIQGWASFFPSGFATDATAAIAVSTSLFIFPAELPYILRRDKNKGKPKCVPALLNWNIVSTKMTWGVIILIGGSFALADASQRSGLTEAIGKSLEVFGSLPTWVINLLINTLVAGLTEFTSNTATTTLVIPIIANMANNIGVNALYLTLPAAVAASFAFMLPVATGPNAIVFSYGHLKVFDMIKCGFLMNILCILLLTLAANTYGVTFYGWDTPAWGQVNITTPATVTS